MPERIKINKKERHEPKAQELEKTAQENEQIMAKLTEIIEITDEQEQKSKIKKFIDLRLKQLEQETKPLGLISLFNEKAVRDFILPQTEIKRVMFLDGFKINDPDIYQYLITALADFYKHWNKPPLKKTAGTSVIYALGRYFGNFFSTQDTEQNNREFYLEHVDSESEVIDLKDLKEKNFAVCVEKASVAHNLLKFLGHDSYLVISNLKIDKQKTESAHAYICLQTKNGKFIFDPTNPVLNYDKDGNISFYTESIYKISDENFYHLVNHDKKEVEIKHVNLAYDGKTYSPKEEEIRIYS